MAFSKLGELQPEAKKVWIKESIRAQRENTFMTRYMGKDENSLVQLITALTRTEKGTKIGISLVSDLSQSGVVGDNQLEGHEEALESSWAEVEVDQHRHAVRSKGKMDDQASVIGFREQARDKLGYWKANLVDDIMILCVSGISLKYQTNGALRPVGNGSGDLSTSKYAAHITPPSSARHFIVSATGEFVAGSSSEITSASVLSYAVIVDLKAEARTRGIKPMRMNGKEFYLFLCHPKAYAQLLKDKDFKEAIQQAQERGKDNPLFTGAVVTMDGLIIAPTIRAFNTFGAAPGSKWGADGNVNGTRSCLMGAQALAFADILGGAEWEEEGFDYKNQAGISIGMQIGVLKPQFKSAYDGGTVQDFGVMVLDSFIK